MSMDALRSLSSQLVQLQAQKEELEKRVSALTIEIDKIRIQQIPTLMEAQGIRNATFEGLGRVQLAADLHASTREGKKEEAMRWLRDCGYNDMIVETYNASSLKALLRRMLADGVEAPSAIFNIQPFTRASVVKT